MVREYTETSGEKEISMVKNILMQVGASETEGRNRGAKPRGEMKSNGSCVLWLFATLSMRWSRKISQKIRRKPRQ